MIDEGQTDWKVVSIDVLDPLAGKLSDISDVEVYMPGLLKTTTDWFRFYKTADGKPINKFAFNARAKTKAFTVNVLRETHQQWCSLIATRKEMPLARTHVSDLSALGSRFAIGPEQAENIVNIAPELGEDAPVQDPGKLENWHHVPMI